MRVEVEPLPVRAAGRRPVHDAAERALEVLDRPHRDRVDHLLPELRVRVRRRQPVGGEHFQRTEVDAGKDLPVLIVLVDDGDVLADRARLHRLPRDA